MQEDEKQAAGGKAPGHGKDAAPKAKALGHEKNAAPEHAHDPSSAGHTLPGQGPPQHPAPGERPPAPPPPGDSGPAGKPHPSKEHDH